MIPVVAARGRAVRAADRRLLRLVHRRPAPSGRRRGSTRCTLRSVEMFWEYEPGTYLPWISPTPLLMVVARGRPPDGLGPGDRRLRAGARAEAARDPRRRALRRLHRGLRRAPAARRATGSPQHLLAAALAAVSDGDRGGPCAARRGPAVARRRGRAGRRGPSARSGRRSRCPDPAARRSRRGRRGRRSAACRGRRRGCRRAGACRGRRRPRRPRRPSSSRLADTCTSPGRSRSRYACSTAFVTASDTTTPMASRSTAIPLQRLQHGSACARRALGLRRQSTSSRWPPQPAHTRVCPAACGFTPDRRS